MASLAKEIHGLRLDVAARRAALSTSKSELATYAARSQLPALADFLPAAGQDEEGTDVLADEPAAILRHEARMEALQRELIEEQAMCDRIQKRLADLQSAAAVDAHRLAAELSSRRNLVPHDNQRSETEEQAANRAKAFDELLAEKRALATSLREQADLAEARAQQAREDEAAQAIRMTAAATRAKALRQGALVQQWDVQTCTLRPCRISLVADGRCFQCEEDQAATAPLLMPLHRIENVQLSVAAKAFARSSVPSHSWLYFSISWRRHSSEDDVKHDDPRANIVVRSPGDSPRIAHFACRSRAECTDWMVGLLEAIAATTPQAVEQVQVRRPGAILWLQMHAMLEERARDLGQRPADVLASAIWSAARDRGLTHGTQPLPTRTRAPGRSPLPGAAQTALVPRAPARRNTTDAQGAAVPARTKKRPKAKRRTPSEPLQQ